MKLVALGLAAQLGCSFGFVTAPPRHPPRDVTPSCDTDSALPALDFAAFGLLFLGTLVALLPLSTDVFGCCDELTRSEATGLSIATGIAATYGLSGVWGLHQLHRCRRFHALPPPPD